MGFLFELATHVATMVLVVLVVAFVVYLPSLIRDFRERH